MAISLTNIENALRIEDIEGLIALGAPSDEYSSEAEKIAAALAILNKNQLNEANIVAAIATVWTNYFNRSKAEIKERLPAFQRIAVRLLN